MRLISKGFALLASASLIATPVSATDLPLARTVASPADALAGTAANHRRHRHYRDRGIDAGDVIAGVLVLGTVAAIVSAVSNNRSDRRRFPVDDRRRGDDRFEESGMDNAISMCTDLVERERGRVADITDAKRDASGWRIAGELERGGVFSCRIGNDGRIDQLEFLDTPAESSYTRSEYNHLLPGGPQYSDETYANARARQRAGAGPIMQRASGSDAGEVHPAYPGGPLPGEEGYDEVPVLY